MSVSGVQLAQGIGVRPAVGFWTDAWQSVSRRNGARFALAWLGIVCFFAVFAPIIASGHPLWMKNLQTGKVTSPLLEFLTPLDLLLLIWGIVAVPFVIGVRAEGRGKRLWSAIGALVLGVAVVAGSGITRERMERNARDDARQAQAVADAKGETLAATPTPFVRHSYAGFVVGGVFGLLVIAIAVFAPLGQMPGKLAIILPAVLLAVVAVGMRWNMPLERFNYVEREATGAIEARYTLVPFSPFQRFSAGDRFAPGSKVSQVQALPEVSRPGARTFVMGTDAFGQDVMTQILHSCRLAISIGLVSTAIALMIGVTIGALMGYFGGWVDMLLYRVVEVFMAVPVLFLLIVMAAIMPPELRTTYFTMAIIGCFSWTGMARFTRAEFLKLRNQDFVQAAQAMGTPLPSVLFKHLLPNGLAPVLVDTSFAVAAAISIEATLSYLGLGPVESASWGKLLSSAISSEGQFKWWLAVFPGAAIFLTVLSYNMLGEALRDAIDPRLKKARV